MKFWWTGQLASCSYFICRQEKLYTAAWFKYLRITLPRNGTTFTRNIHNRAATLIREIFDVQYLTALPTSTALLKLKIWPPATYWIELTRKALAENQKNKSLYRNNYILKNSTGHLNVRRDKIYARSSCNHFFRLSHQDNVQYKLPEIAPY